MYDKNIFCALLCCKNEKNGGFLRFLSVFFCKSAGFLRGVAFLWCCGSVLAGDFGLSPKMTQGGKYSFKKMKFIKI